MSQIDITERPLRKLDIYLEIMSYLGYAPKSLNVQGFNAQAKINFFYRLVLLSNRLLLMSYKMIFTLESWFAWLCVGVQKTLRNRIKQTEDKP